jgi:colicin import membrane protein
LEVNDNDIEYFPMGREVKAKAKLVVDQYNIENVQKTEGEIEEIKGVIASMQEENEAKDKENEELKARIAELEAGNAKADEEKQAQAEAEAKAKADAEAEEKAKAEAKAKKAAKK